MTIEPRKFTADYRQCAVLWRGIAPQHRVNRAGTDVEFLAMLEEIRLMAHAFTSSADGTTEVPTDAFLDGLPDDGIDDTTLSTVEAAERTGLSREYLCRLARDGKIPHQRIGRAWRLYPESLESLSRGNRDRRSS